MNETGFVVQAVLQNNSTIICDEKDVPSLQTKDNAMLLLDAPGRQYSVATRIDAINLQAGSSPTVVVDKRILDIINQGDKVEILKYSVPLAESITIAIPQTSKIFDGDWTPNVRQPLEGKVLDYGNTVPLLIPFETGPVTVAGKVARAIPKCPVCVGPQTKIWLKKHSSKDLDDLVGAGHKEKEVRARVVFEELRTRSLEGVAALKSDVTSYAGDNYPFKETEPRAIFIALQGIFTGYLPLEQPKESNTSESYIGYATYVHVEGPTIKNVIEFHVLASGHSGNVQVSVYSRNASDSRELLEVFYKKISGLQFGLKQRAESAEVKCPNCGSNLPLDKVDAEGYVKCISCRERAILPKRLRH